MKASVYLYLFTLLSLISCNQQASGDNVNKTNDTLLKTDSSHSEIDPMCVMHQNIDTFYLGDMNKDGIQDTAIVFSPFHAYPSTTNFSEGGCEDDSCLTTVKFNFSETILKHAGALGFQTFFATEDLNADGIMEVAFIPQWFQSCWQGLFVYSLKNSSWNQIGSGSVFACADEDFSHRVVKIDQHTFKIIGVRWNEDGSEMVDTAIVHKW